MSAFLVFQIQPMAGKAILPWFGGGPAVWTVCLLFFQTVLLGGYAYAHAIATGISPQWQRRVHVGVLAGAGIVMAIAIAAGDPPILPPASLAPTGSDAPVAHILWALVRGLGLPYFALAATAPLVQHWFARSQPGASPYRLYALSNAGSLLALVSYPFLVEPRLSLHAQAFAWAGAFVVLAGVLAVCATPAGEDRREVRERSVAPSAWTRAAWLVAPAIASMLLLATTNQLCQSVAPIPFLWIVPLALYLVSFIFTFESDRIYKRWLWWPLLAVSLVACAVVLRDGTVAPVRNIVVFDAALFCGCLTCHGEVARLRPAADRLTAFYLSLSAGGALGGAAVAVIAPRVFDGYWELELALWLVAALAVVLLAVEKRAWRVTRPWTARGLALLAAGALGGYAIALASDVDWLRGSVAEMRRGFYGVLSVDEQNQGTIDAHALLYHGETVHGTEFRDDKWKCSPTTYYVETSGVGRAIQGHPGRGARGLSIGAVGLGTGTIAALARAQDHVQYYEIDPQIIALSRGEHPSFHYLDCGAKVDITVGDARLSLEREPARGFDVLAIDAFSGDTIPVHLLTREAMAIYLRHLGPEGILAVHISSRFLDLEPVVAGHVRALGLAAVMIVLEDDDKTWGSDWVLIARDATTLERAGLAKDSRALTAATREWTDDRSDVFSVLK